MKIRIKMAKCRNRMEQRKCLRNFVIKRCCKTK